MRDKTLLFSLFITAIIFSGCSISQKKTKEIKPFKYSALHSAVRLNQISNIKNILKQNKTDINRSDNFGDTPLIDAVRYNYTDIAKVLICNGANVNITDTYNLRPIDNAIKNNNQKIVKMITDKTLSFCKKDLKKNTNSGTNENSKQLLKKNNTQQIQNQVFDLPTTSPQKNSTPNIEKETQQKSKLDKFDLSDEELEKYINDTQSLGDL